MFQNLIWFTPSKWGLWHCAMYSKNTAVVKFSSKSDQTSRDMPTFCLNLPVWKGGISENFNSLWYPCGPEKNICKIILSVRKHKNVDITKVTTIMDHPYKHVWSTSHFWSIYTILWWFDPIFLQKTSDLG